MARNLARNSFVFNDFRVWQRFCSPSNRLAKPKTLCYQQFAAESARIGRLQVNALLTRKPSGKEWQRARITMCSAVSELEAKRDVLCFQEDSLWQFVCSPSNLGANRFDSQVETGGSRP